MHTEHTGIITFKGTPMTLVGTQCEVGASAPDFTVLANNLSPRTLADYKGKTLLISVVPSLDTGVCDIQTRRFNEEAVKLGEAKKSKDHDVRVLTISCDLPFAQARWCGTAGATAVETLSDHRDLSFGLAYGLVIKELRLLTRAILVIDKHAKLVYRQIVPEVAHEPDYTGALTAVQKAL